MVGEESGAIAAIVSLALFLDFLLVGIVVVAQFLEALSAGLFYSHIRDCTMRGNGVKRIARNPKASESIPFNWRAKPRAPALHKTLYYGIYNCPGVSHLQNHEV